jgi:hypothetical protein
VLIGIIVACEIGFWVALGAGLIARYLLRRPRLGVALLILAPLVDLVLLVATTVDLARGATAGFGHGLAAAYIGFSVAFGHGLIRWADERFAHRFAGGAPPAKPPKYGRARALHEWHEFGKATLAWAIACGLLGIAIVVVGDADRTTALQGWLVRLTMVLAVWAIWPVSHTLWPAKPGDPRPLECR